MSTLALNDGTLVADPQAYCQHSRRPINTLPRMREHLSTRFCLLFSCPPPLPPPQHPTYHPPVPPVSDPDRCKDRVDEARPDEVDKTSWGDGTSPNDSVRPKVRTVLSPGVLGTPEGPWPPAGPICTQLGAASLLYGFSAVDLH